MKTWNPWHGCKKISEGCKHCYVYRIDSRHGKDSSVVTKNNDFDLPLRLNKLRQYKIKAGETLYTCFSSDFFLEDADEWREEAWKIIRTRKDLTFFMITKRIHRVMECLPYDWIDGYDNVHISCTVENQDRADYRLPIYKELPVKHKTIICEPLLGAIDLTPYLDEWVEEVLVGGESGLEARACNYEWVLDIRHQCVERDIPFYFKQTGSKFVKDGKTYFIKRHLQIPQAHKANINYKR